MYIFQRNLSLLPVRDRFLSLGCITAVAFASLGAQAVAQAVFDNGESSFTAAQAARGKTAYADSCSMCHGVNLDDGEFAPAIKGAPFKAHWHDQSPAALFSYMTTKMPPSGPGDLSNQTYADIEAYILEANGGQAGATELAAAQLAPNAAEQGEAPGASLNKTAAPRRPLAYHDADYKAAIAQRQSILDRITPVTDEMLLNPPPADWLIWRRTYANLGDSPLNQINKSNVHDLGVAWTLSLPVSANEITPLVHDGVVFIESANTVVALDGVTGDLLWQYIRSLPDALHNGRDARVKNLAIYQNQLFVPTPDGHVIALDVKTGKLLWDEEIITPAQGMHEGEVVSVAYHMRGGPIVAHGKVVIGVSLGTNTGGGDFIVGLDSQNGKELWRFRTIAEPGQPGGDSWNGAPFEQRYGGGVWTSGSYDPELNLVYFGTGNTYDVATLLLPHDRKGDSNDGLFTDTTLALNPDTGKLVWYFQHMNRDVWDLDWVFEQSLVTLPINGKPTKLVVTGGKIAIFDAVDRADGKYEFSKDVGLQNLVSSIDPKTGHKNIDPAYAPQAGKTYFLCPSSAGARSWAATSFDPQTNILYIPMVETCEDYSWVPGNAAQTAAGGVDIRGVPEPRRDGDGKFGRIEAINLETKKVVWVHRQRAGIASSMLVTAGGLAFDGAEDREFRAFDAATGDVLWKTRLNAVPSASPVTYSINGVQYVAIVAGGGSPLDLGTARWTPEFYNPPGGTTLWVFKLAGESGAAQQK